VASSQSHLQVAPRAFASGCGLRDLLPQPLQPVWNYSYGRPIGGIDQTGKWKIDARFNRETLVDRVRKIAEYRSRIEVTNLDALAFLQKIANGRQPDRHFVYLDPPYYEKGRALYLNYYTESDHRQLADHLRGSVPFAWVLTYDNVRPIQKLYRGMRRAHFDLDYHARERRVGKELFVVKDGLKFPAGWSRRIPPRHISSSASALSAA